VTTLAQPLSAPKPFGFPWGTPVGTSEDADLIADKFFAIFRGSISSATGNQRLAEPFHRLEEIFERCKMPNWDGEGASPISQVAVAQTQLLLLTLPLKFPLPEIFPETTGAIALEWFQAPGYRYVATVSGNQTVEFAGLFGAGNEIYGELRFPMGIPRQMQDHLAELYR
jgi:hypothetical protein